MSIFEVVDKIFKKKTNYAEPDQVVDQAESLRYLSTDLYSDSKRFVYELLQNADDSSVGGQKVKVTARLFGEKMVIAHTGKPFDERDLKGVTSVGNGSKKDDPDKTGFKGIGFKAVFGQSDSVIVFTNGEYFRFDARYEHSWNTSWAESQQVWEEKENRKFEVPWQIIPIYTAIDEVDPEIHQFLSDGGWQVATIVLLKNVEDTKSAIDELAEKVNMYLFLKNIESIYFNTGEETRISIEVADDKQTILKLNELEKARWLKKTIILSIPSETQDQLKKDPDMPEKLKEAKKVEITIAAKIGASGLETLSLSEQLIYAYLPTEESNYNLPVLVNAAFYMAANREELHKDSLWNKWLFSCIPAEIFNWIAELVQTDLQFTAYNLLPTPLTSGDKLAAVFNNSYTAGIRNIPFILNMDNHLLRVGQALIDNTFLSEEDFVGSGLVRQYKVLTDNLTDLSTNPFIPRNDYEKKLKAIGVANFDWKDFSKLLSSSYFLEAHNLSKNKGLILYIKNLHDNGYVATITADVLKSWSFIFNQKGILMSPKDVFFPAPGEQYGEETELSFIHPDLNDWTESIPDIKLWLESLGVDEKSDLTYLKKVIIPHVSTYSTPENTIATIRNIFNQFRKGDVGQDLLKQLGQLKLLTKKGNLIPANESFFSNEYQPSLKLESTLDEDIYISSFYLTPETSIGDWKSFFYYFGVKERIDLLKHDELLLNSELISRSFKKAYLELSKFTPFLTTFTADSYRGLVSFALLDHTVTNYEFAKLFWEDIVHGFSPGELQKPARAFWGNNGFAGRTTGDDVTNYLKWYIANIECLPTTTNECLPSGLIFFNGADDTIMASKYLPVFDGPALNADWRAFFNFKPRLELPDYLILLRKIMEDPGNLTNKTKIQTVYAYLLDNLSSWSADQLSTIENWASTTRFADTTGNYQLGEELHFYVDGDYKIFDGMFSFIQLNKENQKHADIELLLKLFKVNLLSQSEFQLDAPGKSSDTELTRKLKEIIPYWATWVESEFVSYQEVLYGLQQRFESLEIFKANELTVTYGKSWQKKVAVHFVDNALYTLEPWNESKVMYTLPAKLCEIFGVKKYDKELGFLLTSERESIIEFFMEEGIKLPPSTDTVAESENNSGISSISTITIPDFNFSIPRKSYEILWSENLRRNDELIRISNDSPRDLLINGLRMNHPQEQLNIYHFSHLENALSIIHEGAIKSRQSAIFKDSAGSGIIAQTEAERKQYARFYFRTKTPTQYYVENLGRGADSIAKIDSDPLCPVPVFFIFPIEKIIDTVDWSVSIGSLASPQVDYGNSMEIISKFDFDGVFKQIGDITLDRFLLAAHQEFLVKDELDINSVPYQLGVQNEAAKKSLLAVLNDNETWETRIVVDPTLYHNGNSKVKIEENSSALKAALSNKHGGEFILQHSTDGDWHQISGNLSNQQNAEKWMTTSMRQDILLKGNLAKTEFKLFYNYKGKIWLIHTNTQNYLFDYTFVKVAIAEWFYSDDYSGSGIINALKKNPELSFWYEQSLPGPDDLTLETHTLAVIENFQKYFNYQNLFVNDKEYLFCLALHDIGKPSAILAGDKYSQHSYTINILEEIRDLLPIDNISFQKMKALIDGDPIGKYLDNRYSLSADESCVLFSDMAGESRIKGDEFWKMLVIYYQCDAAGYDFLQKRLFLNDSNDSIELLPDKSRFLFKNGYEEKFSELDGLIKNLS